ncbi:MAG: aminoacetone oxidase family FAD-binding enzyme [Alicyclobacillus sp.]|nr:aminoacetone oxidase family FAD-binding enzyme [Alicyclobacillus sp.]
MQGISLRNVTVVIRNGQGKRLTAEHGDLLFTHFGLSGPVALRCSHYVSTARRRNPDERLTAEIDCLPDTKRDELVRAWLQRRSVDGRRHVLTLLRERVPDRLAEVILEQGGISAQQTLAETGNPDLERMANTCKAFRVQLTGTLPLELATVTGGGVSVKEIDPRTMESKLCKGLFFAGEVMDVHAHTGGYNITVAFSTGHLAGASAAALALRQRR